jgi:hypothetical protein
MKKTPFQIFAILPILMANASVTLSNGQKKNGTHVSMLFSRAEKDIPEGTSN